METAANIKQPASRDNVSDTLARSAVQSMRSLLLQPGHATKMKVRLYDFSAPWLPGHGRYVVSLGGASSPRRQKVCQTKA
jgi:hypothetical protein